MNLSKANYVRSILYIKELGDLLALYRKGDKQYFVSWAGVEMFNGVNGDVYLAVEVDDAVIADYMEKRITGFDVQKNSPNIFLGMFSGQALEMVVYTFAQAVANEHAMAEGTSFYNEELTYVEPEKLC